MVRYVTAVLLFAFVSVGQVLSQAAGREPSGAKAEPVVVLDTTSPWRMYPVLRPPVIQFEDGVRPIVFGQRRLDVPTAEPAADWRSVGFDDGEWLRGPARLPINSPFVARLCLRGKFEVTSLQQARGLTVDLGYHGGAIVYVNGTEVGRGHLPPGVAGQAALAQEYPKEAFVTEQGELLSAWQMSHPYRRATLDEDANGRAALRVRTLNEVSVPPEVLREGVNVLAVEIIRAPYHPVVDEIRPALESKKADWKNQGTPYDLSWNTCQIVRVRLAAGGANGLAPNAARPEGLQVWNSDVLAADFDVDFASSCEPVRRITMVGARGGSFSGKVVAGSSKPIRGLAAMPTDLKGSAGTIPASMIRVRYALPWGHESTMYSRYDPAHPHQATMLGALADQPPQEYPVRRKEQDRYWRKTPGEPDPVWGAVAPVWVTVKVPPDAAPGAYTGQITIQAEGEKPVSVPVLLKVANWALPDPRDYRTWVELIQSPDTLAVEYGLDLWSDRHFELIAESFKLLHESGSRVLYVPLICGTNLGNDQSMVRWISKGNGQYEHDFSVLDRYLDLAHRHMGQPKVVACIVWDVYLFPKEIKTEGGFQGRFVRKEDDPLAGKGPLVTLLDPAAGKAHAGHLPLYSDPASKPMWESLFGALRGRMKQRGLEGAMMLGFVTDVWPTKEEVAFFKDVAGDLPWVLHAHPPFANGKKLHGLSPVGYQTHVRRVQFTTDPQKERLYGWKRPDVAAMYVRDRGFEDSPAGAWRQVGEVNITGAQRGIGRLGADFWPAVRDKQGQRQGAVWGRHPQSSWSNLNLYTSLLAPGPAGPVSTQHFEALREGVQECEARIFIEQALTDDTLRGKLGADLAQRAQEAMDERLLAMWRCLCTYQLTGRDDNYATVLGWGRVPGIAGHYWFLSSGWQKRSEELYALAAEVSGRLEGR